ncbi:ABC transporter ATP-binding protein [Brachybacterium sp. GPGPB12]|uniref:ABC transporter ATP-binding protein n=1 Tax=Brachybacterium sp. GPGPB12 TaxID=3023517 RepID=UPI00313453B2
MLDSSPAAAAATSSPARPVPGVARSIVRTHRRTLALILPLATVSEGVEMLMPIVLGLLIDHGILAGDLRLTVLGAAGLILLRVLGVLLWVWTFLLSQKAVMYERHRSRVGLTGAVLDPRSRTVRRPAGEVLSIATSDADKASDVMDMIPWVVPSTLAVLGATAYLAVMDLWLGLAMGLGIVVMVVVIRVITPTLSARYDDQQSQAAEAAATATDLVHGPRVPQGLGVQSRARATYRRRSRTALDAALVNARYSGLSSGLTTLVTGTMLAAVVVLASLRTLDGALTLGVLIAVVGLARYVMGMLAGPLRRPGVVGRHVHLGASRAGPVHGPRPHGRRPRADPGRAHHAPRRPRRPRDGPTRRRRRPPPAAAVRRRRRGGGAGLRGSGRRRGRDRRGQRPRRRRRPRGRGGDHARGPAGPAGGPARRAARRGPLRRHPARATRDPRPRAGPPPETGDDGWADAAPHAAGAEDLLRILPEGYDTRILDRGANLSGGQRRRIALARAVAADAPVLVPHDPTTAVDAVTEQNIAEALVAARHRTDRATLLVTRAPALLQAADRVVFVRDGRITAEGEHTDLMGHEQYREVVRR